MGVFLQILGLIFRFLDRIGRRKDQEIRKKEEEQIRENPHKAVSEHFGGKVYGDKPKSDKEE